MSYTFKPVARALFAIPSVLSGHTSHPVRTGTSWSSGGCHQLSGWPWQHNPRMHRSALPSGAWVHQRRRDWHCSLLNGQRTGSGTAQFCGKPHLNLSSLTAKSHLMPELWSGCTEESKAKKQSTTYQTEVQRPEPQVPSWLRFAEKQLKSN